MTQAKLTETLIVDAYNRVTAGESIATIAREYGCSYGTLRWAIRGDTWTHLNLPPLTKPRKVPKSKRYEIDKQRLTNIRSRLKTRRIELGLTLQAVARRLGVSKQYIHSYEADTRLPSVPTMMLFADLYCVPVAWFFEETNTSDVTAEVVHLSDKIQSLPSADRGFILELVGRLTQS